MIDEDIKNTIGLIYDKYEILYDSLVVYNQNGLIGYMKIDGSLIVNPKYKIILPRKYYVIHNLSDGYGALLHSAGENIDIRFLNNDSVVSIEANSSIIEFPNIDFKLLMIRHLESDTFKVYRTETGELVDTVKGTSFKHYGKSDYIPLSILDDNKNIVCFDENGNKGTVKEILNIKNIAYKEIKIGRNVNYQILNDGTILNYYGQLY